VAAKEFLSSRGVRLEEKDICNDAEALRELVQELHSRATPTAVFGTKVVEGFDPAEYEAALQSMPS